MGDNIGDGCRTYAAWWANLEVSRFSVYAWVGDEQGAKGTFYS